MKIMVIGAGVIGSVYAGRLAEAGHDVSLLARGARRAALDAGGLNLQAGGKRLVAHPRIIAADEVSSPVDLTLVAVRTPALATILDLLAGLNSPAVAFLQHLGSHVDLVRSVVGAERSVLAFPGLGGLFRTDGSIEYVEVAAQPTTIDATAAQAQVVRSAIDSTGMRTAMEPDMSGWFATHAVFVACLGAGVLSRGGEASTLAADSAQLRIVMRAIREGFASLQASGAQVTPTPLRVLFCHLPLWFAAAYFRRTLRGPVGVVAIAPHVRASRNDEFAALCADVLDRLTLPETAPTMAALVQPCAAQTG